CRSGRPFDDCHHDRLRQLVRLQHRNRSSVCLSVSPGEEPRDRLANPRKFRTLRRIQLRPCSSFPPFKSRTAATFVCFKGRWTKRRSILTVPSMPLDIGRKKARRLFTWSILMERWKDARFTRVKSNPFAKKRACPWNSAADYDPWRQSNRR